MNRFDLQQQTEHCYDGFPADERPVIGITANYGEQTAKLAEGYYKQVVAAGGIPLIIPPLTSHPSLLTTLNRIDALLLTGGADINSFRANSRSRSLAASTTSATCLSCSSPDWPTTASCPFSASVAASKRWRWP